MERNWWERPEELWKEGQNNAKVLLRFLPANYGKPKSNVHLQEASYHILFQVGRSLAIITNLVTLTMSCTWTGRASKAFARWNIFWNAIYRCPLPVARLFTGYKIQGVGFHLICICHKSTSKKQEQVFFSRFYWNQLKEKSTGFSLCGQHCNSGFVLCFVQRPEKISWPSRNATNYM